MIEILVLIIVLGFIIFLIIESNKNIKNRKKLKHIIHINGIRGKSSTTRLIHAGINNNGINTLAKTTGTLPMIINKENQEELIVRRGRANIKEQIKIIDKAVKNEAEILAIECMAVNPRLQYISQEKILKADIGVLTNVRLDHTEEMGESLEEICESLMNFIPRNGVLITTEKVFFDKLKKECDRLNTKIIAPVIKDEYSRINFKENVACAVEVCKLLGIDEKDALKGMESFIHDPYDLKLYKLPNDALFINGLSINDPDSSELVFRDLEDKYNLENKNLYLLINNRPDRGYRADHMVMLSKRLNPDKIILLGSFGNNLKKRLSNFNTEIIDNVDLIDFKSFNSNDVIYAVGNIANSGDKILEIVEKIGERYV